MIRNTIHTQRSFDNSWTTDTNHGVPSGVIVDLQVTLPKRCEVTLNSLRGDGRGGVYAALYTREGRIAYLHTTATGIPESMNCVPGVTAHILIGYIPRENKEFVDTSVHINPALVHDYDVNDVSTGKTKLTVISDGYTVFNETLDRNITLRTEGAVLRYALSDGTAIVQATADTGSDLFSRNETLDVSPVIGAIRSINHIYPDANGVITITIDADGLSMAGNNRCVSLKATDELNAKLAPEDYLDKYLTPNDGRELPYYTLDDVYMIGGTRGTQRNTFEVLGGTYTFPHITSVEFVGNTIMTATWEQAELETIERMYDDVEVQA